MLLLCTSIPISAAMILPSDETPHEWIFASPVFNSFTWWKQHYLAIFCITLNAPFMYQYTNVRINDSLHWRSSTSMNICLTSFQILYLMKTAVLALFCNTRNVSFMYQYIIVCISPSSKLHINESVPIQLLYLIKTLFLALFCNTGNVSFIVKRVSWFRSSLLLRINNKHTYKY